MEARGISGHVIGFMIAVTALTAAPQARAAVYPTNACVSAKMAAAGAYCQSVLTAWSTWDKSQDGVNRDAAVSKAVTKLQERWTKADATALKNGVDCAETTLSRAALQSMADAAVTPLVTEINTGLDFSNKADAKCGSKLLAAAAKKCAAMLKAESKYIKKLEKDPTGTARGAAKTAATKAFSHAWAKAGTCPTSATQTGAETTIDSLSDQVVLDTTVSPNVDNTQFTTKTPTGPIWYLHKWLRPICMNGSPYSYFVKRGSVNKLLIYYQGGGACWEQITCGGTLLTPAVCDTNVDPAGSDNPNNQHTGFADRSNSLNPFENWNIVFVAYCSCDIHFGDAAQDYDNSNPASPVHVEHRGYENARVVEKWAREHFVNPERIFVTGSSAGAYGAWFNAPIHEAVWPASHFDVLADAGNGVITQDFLDKEFPNWNFAANLPTTIPGLADTLTNGTGIPGYTEVVTAFFADTRWAHYATAFDGGTGGQTGFYNVMVNPTNPLLWLNWWLSSCDFNSHMVQQAQDTYTAVHASTDNYRYYIGSGSRHTMWGSNKVYSDTTGGVPLLVDWVNAMLTGGPDWGNVEASPFNVLLPGDAQPSPLAAPFETSGSNVIVNCP